MNLDDARNAVNDVAPPVPFGCEDVLESHHARQQVVAVEDFVRGEDIRLPVLRCRHGVIFFFVGTKQCSRCQS